MGTPEYHVHLSRQFDAVRAVSTVRDFSLTLGVHRGDSAAGFNAVETLLSAVGACVTTSLGMVAEMSRVQLSEVEVDVAGTRQDRPPILTAVRFVVAVRTDASDEKLLRLLSLAERNSTVVSTLRLAIPVTGKIVRK